MYLCSDMYYEHNVGFMTTLDLLITQNVGFFFFHSLGNTISLFTSLSKGKTTHLFSYPKRTSTKKEIITHVGTSKCVSSMF